MPKGPAGGPRPFAQSDLAVKLALDISEADVPDTPAERSREMEQFIRDRTDIRVDVKFGPAFTFILTRQQSIDWESMKILMEAIGDYTQTTGIRITQQPEVMADGE